MTLSSIQTALAQDGYILLRGVYGPEEIAAIGAALSSALEASSADPAIRGSEGAVYAARNVLTLWPGVAEVWRRPVLTEALTGLLGVGYGLVRVLYFDKPPGESWALPWHKDLTVALRDNSPGAGFCKPTTKAGVPHAEAPVEVLEAMLTARLHLDEVTEENGPLKVIPGSHRQGKTLYLEGGEVRTILAAAGDVLLMRPLVAHSSNRSQAGTSRHRRILHLEFAAAFPLPGSHAWHDYLPG